MDVQISTMFSYDLNESIQQNMTKLTIVTVVFNDPRGVRRTLKNIENIKEQVNFEYVVIDGKSNDGTTDIIQEYHSVVDVLISEQDNGIYDAMNKGIRLATGEYIGLLNAGDTYEVSSVIKVYKLIQNSNHDLVYGSLNVLDDDFKLISVNKANTADRMFFCGPKHFNHPAFFIKKKVYEDLGYYKLKYGTAGDYEFVYNAYLKGYSFLKTDLVHTNFVKGGASYKKSPFQVLRIYKDYFHHKPLWSILGMFEKIFIKYPLFLLLQFIPKHLHFKYKKLMYRFTVVKILKSG